MVIYTPPSVAKNIPVIDLLDSFSHDIEKRKAVAWEIHKAARQTGFFYIKNPVSYTHLTLPTTPYV